MKGEDMRDGRGDRFFPPERRIPRLFLLSGLLAALPLASFSAAPRSARVKTVAIRQPKKSSSGPEKPSSSLWWMQPSPMAQIDTLPQLQAYGAAVALHGAAADPVWGLLTARIRYDDVKSDLRSLKKAGVPCITWVEGFGDATAYAAALAVGPDGRIERDPKDSAVPRLILNHWGWQHLTEQPAYQSVWMGPEAYYDDLPWARPFTRTHPRYGAPIPRYPDGRPALGFNGDPSNPVNARIFDAGGSKDLNGRLHTPWGVNDAANRLLSAADSKFPKEGAVPITVGTDEIDGAAPGPAGSKAYATQVSVHKDAACPFWIEYAAASFRQISDFGLDGLWCDNFSPWDNFGYPPIEKAFGDWSVARFAKEASSWGLAKKGEAYDIRADLKARFRRYFPGRDPNDIGDPSWRDPRWLDDPAWRAYRSFKRRAGAEALSALTKVARAAGRASGRDFAVNGNDIPLYDLGWVRPDYLDRANTELSPGWHMGTGSAGTGFLPEGRLSPVYRLQTEYGRSPYGTAWLYLEGEYGPYRTRPGAFKAAAAEAMLGRVSLLGYDSSGRTAGTPAEHAEWNRFVRRAAPVWNGRIPLSEAGIVWSPSSILANMAPGGNPNMDAQPHSFGYFGWATFLEEEHIPYRALPDFKIDPGALDRLRLLILPDAVSMTEKEAGEIEDWVKRGGELVATGSCGTRYGEDRAAMRRGRSLLADLLPPAKGSEEGFRRCGKGSVVYSPDHPGMTYYLSRKDRAALRPAMRKLLHGFSAHARLDAPSMTGFSLYREPDGGIQADLANLDYDRETDKIEPVRDLTLSFPEPAEWKGRPVVVKALYSDGGSDQRLRLKPKAGRIALSLTLLRNYATLVFEPEAMSGP